ncbi:MAG: hypothetical protein NZ552_06455 [Planctomycetes bacterium]|nr:hypothetical protein [Planctomycetota bacterium]
MYHPTGAPYGSFGSDGVYTLTREPPRKWRNVHTSGIGPLEYVCEVSNIGDGISWVRDNDGVTCVLVGWDAKYLYIRDEDSGTVFCPGGAPAPQRPDYTVCRYHAAWTELHSVCQGLSARQRVFVPLHHPLEIWTLFVENLTDRPRRLSVFAYALFQLTGCDREGKGIWKDNICEVRPELGGVFCTNRSAFAPTPRFKAYLLVQQGFVNGNGYRDHFTREEYSVGTPRILWGWNCDGRPGAGSDCAGTVQAALLLPPRGSARLDVLLGSAESEADAQAARARWTPEAIEAACAEQVRVHGERAARLQFDTGSATRDGLLNGFLAKQLNYYLINKSGFRDNLQNDQAYVMVDAEAAVANALRALSSMHPEGWAPHGFRPLNRQRYSDMPAWVLTIIPELVKETGDLGLLAREIPYSDGSTGSVWDHILRAMRLLARDTGRHGLCNQHHADWNDGLEATREAGERESVMVTQQFCAGLREVEELARRLGEHAVAEEARGLYQEFARRINEVAWDGEWYQRTLCGDGYRIGSRHNDQGRIFMNTQSWAVISGIAPPERARLCMDSVERLLREPVGYRLCGPPFFRYDPRVGRMSNSIPGAVENGGCYNHACGFKAVADCMLGRAAEAWNTLLHIFPDHPENPVSRSGQEPFALVNSFSCTIYDYGKAGQPWQTGTAGWTTVALVQWVLGVRRTYDGLLIDPCTVLPRARLLRHFRGAVYEVHIDNREGRNRGARRIVVDGTELQGNLVPSFGSGYHRVEVLV